MPQMTDPIAFSLGPLDIRWYALFILLGIASAISLSYSLAERRGLDGGFILDIAPWVVFLSIAGARLYYVILEWDRFQDDLRGAVNFRSGGLSIHGGIVAGILAVIVLCHLYQQPARLWMDMLVPGLALGQAIGRWGNWANQEAFGKPTDVPWAITIDPARRPADYPSAETFHPTFLYESLFNLLNAAILSWLVLRTPRIGWMRPGDVAALYLIAYGLARFVLERMRTDSLYIGPLPAALWFSMALVLGGVLFMALNRTVFASHDRPPPEA